MWFFEGMRDLINKMHDCNGFRERMSAFVYPHGKNLCRENEPGPVGALTCSATTSNNQAGRIALTAERAMETFLVGERIHPSLARSDGRANNCLARGLTKSSGSE